MDNKPQAVFADGMFLKDRRPNCPDYVKATIAFKVDDFMRTLQSQAVNGWLTVNLKVSQNGKKYFQVDTWKPRPQDQQPQQQVPQQQAPPPQTQSYGVAPVQQQTFGDASDFGDTLPF